MWQCHYCRFPLPLDVQAKNRLCPNCNSDIHSCKNCTHYDKASAAKCKESEAEWVRDRAGLNHCHYFEFRTSDTLPSPTGQKDNAEAEAAKAAFRALFRS